VNIKKYDYETAYKAIGQWLDKCSQKLPLRFNVRYKVNYTDMYQEIMLKSKR